MSTEIYFPVRIAILELHFDEGFGQKNVQFWGVFTNDHFKSVIRQVAAKLDI